MHIKNRECPCCGTAIMPYQERCLNCLVYLWEVADGLGV